MFLYKRIKYDLNLIPASWQLLSILLVAPSCVAQGLPGSTSITGPDLIPREGPALYDREHPVIGYSSRPPVDRFAILGRKLATGEITLNKDTDHGYLRDLLDQLDIDPESQVLVYSRTSLNTGLIQANSPRAIYFNDDTYVAWVAGNDALEIASMDPNLGPVFYLLDPDSFGTERHAGQCLRCHDSLTLTGGGVPRFILGSGYTYFNGSLVSHEGWILTDQQTPLKFRWGGWYVSGQHGSQVHLGNIVVSKAEELQDLENIRRGNIKSLDDLIDTEKYLTPFSDIDALMVMEHQVQVQNLITRVNYDTRNLLVREFTQASVEQGLSEAALEKIKQIAEPLIEAMFLTGEAAITDTIKGNSGFRDKFERRGPIDSVGRSLRQLDLNSRLFRYPLSYLIYSSEFEALPGLVKQVIYNRVNDILNNRVSGETYAHLDENDRVAILEILAETKPAMFE